MIALALSALLLTAPASLPHSSATQVQDPVVEEAPIRLEDIDVTGRSLQSTIDRFVGEVAAPNRNRSLARWRQDVCVGAINFEPEVGQYLVDRVSTIGSDLGLQSGAPGCKPSVLIIAATNADEISAYLSQIRGPARLRLGGTGTDRGAAALRAFETSERPVRWWQNSLPVDADTGQRATRIPGECTGSCSSPYDYAPLIATTASRLTTRIVDDIFRTIIVVDVAQAQTLQAQQLADYIAMVTFAQIDPEADTGSFSTILNVFETPDQASGLTQWDQTYLAGLYDAQRTLKSLGASRVEIANSIRRAHYDLRQDEPGDE